MPLTTKHQPVSRLEAFCSTCPPVEEVTVLLAKLGFRLAFQMEEQRSHSSQLPPLPAQYHYKADGHGTEVIYLAGRDIPLEGEFFPPHASRFWLYPGADFHTCQLAAATLGRQWRLPWLHLEDQETREEVA